MDAKKKKVVILAVLVVAILAIGAWQVVGGGSKPAPAPKAPSTEPAPEPIASNVQQPDGGIESDLSLVGLKHKDPFQPGTLPTDEASKPTPQAAQQEPSPAPRGPGIRPQIGGYLPPAMPGGGQITPTTPMQPSDAFDYSLVGVVDGPNPVAVFKSSSGSQSMVRLDGAIGQGGRVTGITKGRVTVLYNGKTTTLTVGGNSQ